MNVSRILLLAVAIGLWACGPEPATDPTVPVGEPDIPVADTTVLTLEQLPDRVPQAGELAAARTWTDAEGAHLLTVFIKEATTTGDPEMAEDEFASEMAGRILLAQQYTLRNDSIAATEWMWESLVDQCPLDLTLRLDTVYLTDLDRDGRREVTLVVSRSCKGDVSPDELQVVLHEGGDRMLLEGYHWLPQMDGPFDTTSSRSLAEIDDVATLEEQLGTLAAYGRYARAEGFGGRPEVFRQFAEQVWDFHRDQ